MAKKKVIKINFWGEEKKVVIQKHHFSKSIRLSVSSDQEILISIPPWSSFRKAENFFWKEKEWVSRAIFEIQQKKNQELVFKGQAGLPLNCAENYVKIKKIARQIVQEKIQYFNQWYGFQYEKIFIRNQRTRWGSCSERRNLSFNARIALLPPHLQDYIVVHELCHLKEMNHSLKFWQLVELTISDYKKRRKELKKIN